MKYIHISSSTHAERSVIESYRQQLPEFIISIYHAVSFIFNVFLFYFT